MLALDQGTSSSRAIVFGEDGEILASASRELPQIYPRPGWVEHDPEAIWSTQIESAMAALASSGLEPKDVAAIGIANQRETTLIWDRSSGKPVANAVVWQCRRTAPLCQALVSQGAAGEILARTGLVIDPYFSGTKIAWLLDAVDGRRAQAEAGRLAFGTVDSWLIWRLTAGRVHATDFTNASRTMLFNLQTLDWDPELLQLLRVPLALLPSVQPSCADFGVTDARVFGASVSIRGVAGDQQAALFGQACFAPGMAKNTYGTGSFLLLNIGERPRVAGFGLLTTVGIATSRSVRYALEGSVFVSGAAVDWLRDGLGIIATAEDVERLAGEVQSSEGVYVVPAFTGLGAPHWDMRARGTIVGLTLGTGKRQIARAVLEAIALQSADVASAMEAESGVRMSELRVDGGAAVNDLLMQIQADILNAPVVRARRLESTAVGAAWLAGLGAAVWPNESALAAQWRQNRRFQPRMAAEERERLRRGWKRAIERSRGWTEEDGDGISA